MKHNIAHVISGTAFALAFGAITLGTVIATLGAEAQEIDGSTFRSEGQGDWYHPIEAEDWERVGSDPDVIASVLANIAQAKGKRANESQPDTIIAYGPGNWTFEWARVGDVALAAAEQAKEAGNKDLARRKYTEAMSYFLRASSPHTDAPEHVAALEKAERAYREIGKFLPVPLRVVEVPYEGKTFKANLHLPEGSGPFPLVIMTFGSDVAKEEGLTYFEKQLSVHKIALLLLDTPGMGDSRAWRVTPDSDKLHVAAVEYMKSLPEIDERNIFLQGGSFGGLPVARAFLARPEIDLAGAIYMCGPMHSSFMAPPQAMAAFPKFTLDGVRTRVGLSVDSSNEQLAAKLRPLSLVNQGLMGPGKMAKIDTPLLVVTTNRDPAAPIEDVELLMARANDAEAVIYDEVGHCPGRDSREAIAASWIRDKLR